MSKKFLFAFQWVIITALTVITVLLMVQNIRYRNNYANENKRTTACKKIVDALEFEKGLKINFQFKKFPLGIPPEQFNLFPDDQKDSFADYLIMVFDLTVCGKCLRQELALLKKYKDFADERNLLFLAVIGISSKSEESEIISMYKSGELFFPFKTLKVDDIYETFRLNNERYLDTPFFIYASNDLNVLDIFKPVYLDTKEFKRWLEIILK